PHAKSAGVLGIEPNPLGDAFGERGDRQKWVAAQRAWHDRAIRHVESLVYRTFICKSNAVWIKHLPRMVHHAAQSVVGHRASSQRMHRHQVVPEHAHDFISSTERLRKS